MAEKEIQKPIREGMVKKGGVNQPPEAPKQEIRPPAQEPQKKD